MRLSLLGTISLLLAAVPSLYAVHQEYETGVVLKVEQKAHTRVLYYIVNTPVTQDDPYYEVSIRFGDAICVGEYDPRHAADAPPGEWQVGASVQARVEKHHMFIKGPGMTERDLVIIRHTPAREAKDTKDTSQPASRNKN